MNISDLNRFTAKIAPDSSGCILWTAHIDRHGYGVFHLNGKDRRAHRVAYEHFVGPIPDGLTIDHLCRTRACVNPAHMEPVTNEENLRRGIGTPAINAAKTECWRGHPFDEANTLRMGTERRCRACERIRQAAMRGRRRSARVGDQA